ncbi:HlyC/CorC family transporter [Ferrimonas balearica]|uniref:HlyC/CorC family transporter n=1 Tax=Ferrimonas balearica TaxID=44012 RepID=UPI001C991A74|nr:HlyC/CorC family transporter [Ferrimonas balearica]MBY5922858.1 HlyC/CorC family transporter [Ferrimonas balearica]MBY5997765.1 HlyC/CorC family transporter [Ferrimonas balearica]
MDDIPTGSLLLILALLILISAFFSGTETAMMSLNRYRLRHLAQKGHKGAQRAERLLQRPDRLIGLILIGNNIVNIAAASLATIICQRWYGDWGPAIATGGLTFIILIFAEVTPKTLAAQYPEKLAYPNSLVLRPLMSLFYPFVWLVNHLSNGILRVLRLSHRSPDGDHLSTDELRSVVHEAGGLIPRRHREMLVSILDLEKVTVEEIMIPRAEIYAIDINDDYRAIIRQLTHSPHTRVLLYRDNIDDVVGVVHLSDVLRLFTKDQKPNDKSTLLRAVREIYFIPEGTPLNVQLLKFQRAKERIGLVVDEYGDIQGLVTLEDILEEIVGDFTTGIQGPPSEGICRQEDGSLIVDASITVRDLNRETHWTLPTDGPKTLNGLILELFEDIPDPQTRLEIEGHGLEVIEVADNRVKSVRFLSAN